MLIITLSHFVPPRGDHQVKGQSVVILFKKKKKKSEFFFSNPDGFLL